MSDGMRTRLAEVADLPIVDAIAARSVRTFHVGFYEDALIEEAVRDVYGADWQLVRDGTYFVVEVDGAVVGGGGWSLREAIGGARGPDASASPLLDPAYDAARIRAFYVDPAHARRGVAASLLRASEYAALAAGFGSAELTATLASEAAWTALGYRAIADYEMRIPSGSILRQKLMRKELAGVRSPRPGPGLATRTEGDDR